ncbi:MAG: ABC transporter ATP-binding protein [Planctomycetota bacterium]|nr:ABC transporter ATP-binding protein [Planctomycetota bacterium]
MTDGESLSLKSVSFRAGGNEILKKISLSFHPGQITAIIGPSGSGKSTLLKCLTTTVEPSDGKAFLGAQDLAEIKEDYRQKLGYVPQDDVLHRELSVESAFYYSARLRLDPDLTEVDIQIRIGVLAALLGLAERQSHKISKLSGGQRKRVNIGIELLADPAILILDEPASGLDPGTEEDLLKFLQILAEQGRTIVLTTHSMEFLDVADRIVLLMDGYMIFAGDLKNLLEHFGIVHIADVFKAIRENDAKHWARTFSESSLSACN